MPRAARTSFLQYCANAAEVEGSDRSRLARSALAKRTGECGFGNQALKLSNCM